MEKIKRTVSVSNILSVQTFWPHVKHLSGVVAHRLDVVCTELKHKSPNTNTHTIRLIEAPPPALFDGCPVWLIGLVQFELNTEVFHVHAFDSEPGLMVYATPWFAWFVLLSQRCNFTLYMEQVLNIFTCTCTLLYHIMETASGKHNMSQWQPSGPRSSHSRLILELGQVFLYCLTGSWISKCTYFSLSAFVSAAIEKNKEIYLSCRFTQTKQRREW